MFDVDSRTVFQRSNQRELNDAVPACGNARGLQVKGEDLLAVEEVVCHEEPTARTLFEHHP